MSFVIAIAVLWATTIWVYVDATNHKVGKTRGREGRLNMSAGGWAIATLALWIVAFPAYLAKRSSLIEAATLHPVEAQGRGGKTAALALAGIFSVLAAVALIADGSLPACDSQDTVNLLSRTVNGMPVVRAVGAEFVSVKDVWERGFDSQSETRLCEGTLVNTVGEELLHYRVTWYDKAANAFYVRAQIVGD